MTKFPINPQSITSHLKKSKLQEVYLKQQTHGTIFVKHKDTYFEKEKHFKLIETGPAAYPIPVLSFAPEYQY